VRRVASLTGAPLRWAMGSPDLARRLRGRERDATLLLFDGQGRRAGSFYGAPPGLHAEVEAILLPLLE